jgi:hypothetical protein
MLARRDGPANICSRFAWNETTGLWIKAIVMGRYFFQFETEIAGDDRIVVRHPASGHTYTFVLQPGGGIAKVPVIGAPDGEMAHAQSRAFEAHQAAKDAARTRKAAAAPSAG